MEIGIVKECGLYEYRVSLIPSTVSELIRKCNAVVYIESNAGSKAGFTDAEYTEAGAYVCLSAKSVYKQATLIVKVEKPEPSEYKYITAKHCIMSFCNFANNNNFLDFCLNTKLTSIVYDSMPSIQSSQSQLAGELFVHQGVKFIKTAIQDSTLTIIGAGILGQHAATFAKQIGFAKIILLDKDIELLSKLSQNGFNTAYASHSNISRSLSFSHLVIGCISVPCQKTPQIITREMLDYMLPDAVFIDTTILQGGITQISKLTTIQDPIIEYNHIKLCCIPNICSLICYKSSKVLSSALSPFIKNILEDGLEQSKLKSAELKIGLSIQNGIKYHPCL